MRQGCDPDDVGRMSAACAFGVIRVNRAACDGRDRILHEAGFVDGIGVNRGLHIHRVRDPQTSIDRGGRCAPILVELQTTRAGANHIDATSNLARSRAWLFAGHADETVYPAVVYALREFYAAYQTQVALVANQPAGHGMVTERAGNACGASAPPYIVHCDYDAAGELLRFLLGALAAPAAKESGRLVPFDQRRYAGNDAHGIAMDDTGFAYVPERCAKERCRIHVAFHGCRQGAAEIGERFVREAGYNRWADTNALVILYPQAIMRYSPLVFNPRGCWDWWGYSSAAYHTREAPQIRAVMGMIERLSE